jgi:hypothetical protein
MFKKLMTTTLGVCIVVLMLTPAEKAAAEKMPNGTNPSIFEAIKNGGYILYFRHGEATIGQDQPGLSFNDCTTQRNLSETGKNQARMIGNIFRAKMIPIAYPVIASPYCRTLETAELAFGKPNITVNPILAAVANLGMGGFSVQEAQNALAEFMKILETPPIRGSNKIIVGHSFPDGQVLGEIPYMGTVVIRPKGQGKGYEIVARISLEEFIKAWKSASRQ